MAAELQDRNSECIRAASTGYDGWNLIYSVLLLLIRTLIRHSVIQC